MVKNRNTWLTLYIGIVNSVAVVDIWEVRAIFFVC